MDAIEHGHVRIEFDARTGHNHGTKFRLQQRTYPYLYASIQEIEDDGVKQIAESTEVYVVAGSEDSDTRVSGTQNALPGLQ